MWELDQKEGWILMLLNYGVGKASWESLGLQGDQTSSKANQPWIFTGNIHVEAEAPVLWPPDVKIWLTGKDPDAGKEWKQKEKKGTTEDKVVVWYHRLSGQEFEQILGDGEGQEGLVCCSPWGHKESDTTEWLNWTESSLAVL